jgi:cobalamin biosynthesis protein CobT
LHVSNQEYLLLDSEIKGLQQNIQERTKMNTLLRKQVAGDNDKVEQMASQFGYYGCNDQIAMANEMEDTAGISHIPQHVRSQDTTPVVFALADNIRKLCENEMSFKMGMVQQNNDRNTFEIKQIQTYQQRQHCLKSTARMLLSDYYFTEKCAAMDISEEEEEEDDKMEENDQEEEEEEEDDKMEENDQEEEEEEEDDKMEEGIGCNHCYACVSGGSSPCIMKK